MCENCYVLKELFEAAESNSHQNYIPTLACINVLLNQGVIELFAGDCPLEEVEKHLCDEIHYTVCHYFRCKNCSQYFFIGACVRGTPIYKTLVNLKNENLENMLWGCYGVLYE